MKKISLYLTIALVILLSFSQSLLAQSTLVNINTASFEELQTLHNIGPIKAQAIIDYRTANDLFIYPDEIKNVTGIAEGIYDDIKDHITTGAKLVSGDISGDEVWSSVPGEFYALNGDVTVPAGSSLVVEADTVVMYDRGPFRKIIVAGNLTFSGEAESQITLERVGLEVLSEASFVSNHAKFTGPGGYGIYQIAGSVEVENSTFSAFNNGVLTTSGDLSLNSSTFESNTEYGINVSGSSTVELNNNIFSNNLKMAYVSAEADFSHSGNTADGSGEKGFERSGPARADSVWHSDDLPTIISSLVVDEGNTLTLSPGTILKMKSGSYIDVRGALSIQGSKIQPVVLTSFKDDSVFGDTNGDAESLLPTATDWNGITFYPDSTGDLIYVEIKYSGGYAGVGQGSGRSGMFNLGGDIVLDNVSFKDNFSSDIYQEAGSLTGTKTDFGSLQTGFVFAGGSATVSQSKFYQDTNSIENTSSEVSVDARNNWWGSETGPTHVDNPEGSGGRVYGGVLYDPWLDSDPLTTSTRNPVIIVPGIMGSELLEDKPIDDLVWPNTIQLVASINDVFLDILKMDITGVPLNDNIIVGEVIKNLGNADYFEGLASQLISQGYKENIDLFEMSYDWRVDVSFHTNSLKEKIDEVKILTGSDKIVIVAHSMGGLLVKKYLEEYEGDTIKKFIDIGTPHTGSPAAYKTIMYGDDLGVRKFFGLIGINTERIKIISQNMPSIYQLLPSRNYFDDTEKDYRYYVFDGVSGQDRLSFDQTKDYLKNSGRNGLLVDRADELHQEIDGLNPSDYGVETYNIVSCGAPTLGQIFVIDEKSPGKFSYNIRMIDGDGTVPLRSAEAMAASSTYYFSGVQHALMPSASGIRELIVDLLTGEEVDSSISKTSSICGLPNGNIISFHSPIELHVYDELGNHAGPNEEGDIINEIDGIVYEVIDDNKFAFLPDGIEYTINGLATDSGTFDVLVQEIVGGEVATTTIFSDLPLTQTTQAKFFVGSTTPNQIALDHEGDEVFESNHDISSVVLGIVETMVVEEVIPEMPVEVSVSTGSSRIVTPPEPVVDIEIITSDVSDELVTVDPERVTLARIDNQTEELVLQKSPPIPSQSLVIEDSNQNVANVYQAVKEYFRDLFIKLLGWIRSKI